MVWMEIGLKIRLCPPDVTLKPLPETRRGWDPTPGSGTEPLRGPLTNHLLRLVLNMYASSELQKKPLCQIWGGDLPRIKQSQAQAADTQPGAL